MKSKIPTEKFWLALMIGNSRLHWAYFKGQKLQQAWDSAYLPAPMVTRANVVAKIIPPNLIADRMLEDLTIPVYLASVVPDQTALWQNYPDVHLINLEQVPLQGMYSTLGIDRALAVWGAGETYGFPTLVIDAGTALTLTGVTGDRIFVGGAILPGVRLQIQSLSQKTANLPAIDLPENLPQRWGMNTLDAIASGVMHTIIAGLKDFIAAWWQEFPDSCIAIAGGDGALILTYLQVQFPQIANRMIADPYLIFWGMREILF